MDVAEIISRLGGTVATARLLQRDPSTVSGWKKRRMIPVAHVRAVSRATGIPPHELRPDLWDPPDTGPRQEAA